MTVKELKIALNDIDDDMEVLTKKTEICGNVAYVNSIRKKTYKLTEKDRIIYNGKAYILMTQTVRDNFINIHPTLTTSLVQKLIKEGKLVLANGKFVSDYTGAEYDMYIVSKN